MDISVAKTVKQFLNIKKSPFPNRLLNHEITAFPCISASSIPEYSQLP